MDPLKEAFSKVKDEISILKSTINSVREDINFLKNAIKSLEEKEEKRLDKQTDSQTDNEMPQKTASFQKKGVYQEEPDKNKTLEENLYLDGVVAFLNLSPFPPHFYAPGGDYNTSPPLQTTPTAMRTILPPQTDKQTDRPHEFLWKKVVGTE